MRLIAATFAGCAAFALAVGTGIPVWVDWPSWSVPADAADIGILTFASVHLLTKQQKDTNA